MKSVLIVGIILIIAAGLRLTGVNWDQGFFLHPDERFLGMVTRDLNLTSSWREYMDPQTSSLNPRNQDYDFYVYGNWPLTLNKLISTSLGFSSLHKNILVGRVMSAAADLLVVILVFKTGQLIAQIFNLNSNLKYFSALAYTLMVLPIQQAHFFTTDTFLNLFSFAGFYFSLLVYKHKKKRTKWWSLAFAGICWGIAIAAKINAVLIGPLVLFLILAADNKIFQIKRLQLKQIKTAAAKTLIFLLTAYISLRLASPYMFAGSNWLNLTLSPDFLQNIQQLRSWSSGDVWFPPSVQWFNRTPVLFALKTMVVFGVGLPIFLLGIFGLVKLIKLSISELKNKHSRTNGIVLLMVMVWCLAVFGYQSTQFVKSIRYLLILYPFLALTAGLGISRLLEKIHNLNSKKLTLVFTAVVILAASVWPLMFLSIYIKPHSRIQASHWIYQNIPADSMLLTEHWDDSLPLNLPQYQKQYTVEQLPVFNKDNSAKWSQMQQQLEQGDYYILSSNRAWGSIPRVPEKYPQMSQFYQRLLAEKGDYELAAEFHSYPSLKYLGIPITFKDFWAEETFTVYDHPQVLIFKLN